LGSLKRKDWGGTLGRLKKGNGLRLGNFLKGPKQGSTHSFKLRKRLGQKGPEGKRPLRLMGVPKKV